MLKAVSTAVGGAIGPVQSLATQIQQRIDGLGLNERLRDELCSRVKELQDALWRIEATASNIDDRSIMQKIADTENDMKRCLSACDRIEKQPYLAKFSWKFTSNSRDVEELYRLLTNSAQMLVVHIAETMYSSNVDMQRKMKQVESRVQNPQAGIYPLDGVSADESKPERIEKPFVKEKKPGVLHVSWENVANARYYELQYDQHTYPLRVEQTSLMRTEYLLEIKFPSKFSYEIRVRGVNGAGPGEWSEYTVGEFTVLPSPPHLLAIRINSYTSVTLVVGKAHKEQGVKPVTDYVVMWYNDAETDQSWIERTFNISELEALTLRGKDAYKINLDWNTDFTPMPMYHVKISLRNADGDSLPYKEDISTDTIEPGEPVEQEVVIVTTRTIIIKWKKPETNACIVNHYEVHWGRNGNITKFRKTENCYAVFRGLETGKKYLFKVRSISKTGTISRFLEIDTETNSMAGKVAKTIGAGAAGGAAMTVAMPLQAIAWGALLGTAVGLDVAEKTEDKSKATQVVASTAAGIGAGSAGFAAGAVLTPLAIVVSPIALITGAACGASFVLNESDLDDYLKQYPDDSTDEDSKTEIESTL